MTFPSVFALNKKKHDFYIFPLIFEKMTDFQVDVAA